MTIQIRTSLAEPETGQSFIPHRPARPEKVEGGRLFKLVSMSPLGDQPHAIEELVEAANAGEKDQVLLGVTGSGKTFTMAKVIEAVQRPAPSFSRPTRSSPRFYGEFELFPRKRGRMSSLITIIPARGLCTTLRHLYREGVERERGDRPDAPLRHPRAAGAR